MPPKTALADVQGNADSRGIAIEQAGIADLLLPLPFTEADGSTFVTVAQTEAWTEVPCHQRGAHMSRLAEELGRWRTGLSLAALPDWLAGLADRMVSTCAGAKVSFPLFLERLTPISGRPSWLDCKANIAGVHRAGVAVITVEVIVPVTTLCPCSKEVSDEGAHSQRSELAAKVTIGTHVPVLRELAERIESHASAQLHAVLKRDDEKFVTEGAYARPRFAEDVVRELAADLNASAEFTAWRVAVRNLESIHNHDAFAVTSSAVR